MNEIQRRFPTSGNNTMDTSIARRREKVLFFASEFTGPEYTSKTGFSHYNARKRPRLSGLGS